MIRAAVLVRRPLRVFTTGPFPDGRLPREDEHRRRNYHATAQSPILLLVGAVAMGGFGYVACKKLKGQTVMPYEAYRAQESYQKLQQDMLIRNQVKSSSVASKPTLKSIIHNSAEEKKDAT